MSATPNLLLIYFVFDPWLGLQQLVVLLIAWTHDALGIWYGCA